MLPGTSILEAAAQAGHILETPCGGVGKCGKCLVRVTGGTPPAATETERRTLGLKKTEEGYRLACQCRATSPLTIEIPDSSLFQTGQKILQHSAGGPISVRPRTVKKFVKPGPPSREGPASDMESLKAAVGAAKIDITVMQSMPDMLRDSGWEVTATTIDDRLIDLEPGNTAGRCFGVAFDVGTTTLVGILVDLMSGAELAITSEVNPQTSFGDDVVSRIKLCRETPDGLARLREAILRSINAMIGRLQKQAGVERRFLYEAVFAGNTTMQQILCGISPRALGEIPFAPAFREPIRVKASDLDVAINPRGDVHVLPQIGGFVGGDTVAGIIAARLDRIKEPALLVDVGTNGEIVLSHNGRLTATSVAAGPAFEGARIVHGMRGTTGAIEKVVLDGGLRMNVIGNVKPKGICGSGLIDATAELLRTGAIDFTGRILAPEELPPETPEWVRRRLVENSGSYDFVLADESETATRKPIVLCQRDIRELQLANGAIRAGITLLLSNAGLKPEDLGVILLAGAFGNFIRRRNARRIGMFPPVPCEKIRYVGNTASLGAKMVLLSRAEEQYAAEVAVRTSHLDLSLDPEFQSAFSAAMLFPENDFDHPSDANCSET